MIAIGAPAGYGKTTLLADFVHNTDIPTVWLQVTEAEADPARLAELI